MARKPAKKSKKPAKKSAARKAAKKPARKAAAKKPARRAAPKKAAAKKPAAKKAAAKKPAVTKSAKKPAPKQPAMKAQGRSARARISSAASRAESAREKWEARPKHRVEEDEPRPHAGDRDAAFVNRPDKAGDDLAEELGESFLQSATSGEEAGLDIQNEETEEEQGGPFIETTAQEEFADDVDESNPEDAEPAALPTTASDNEAEE